MNERAEDPRCEKCDWPLHRYRDLTLCQECEDAERRVKTDTEEQADVIASTGA